MDTNSTKPKGESFVWLSSMGLATGLLMITAILGVIIYYGVGVFWPKAVAEYSLVDNSNAQLNGSSVIAGELHQRRAKSKVDKNDVSLEEEIQLYLANKGTYGLSFKWYDTKDIANLETPKFPKDIMMIERAENSRALVYPMALQLQNGEQVAFADEKFSGKLEELVDNAATQRAKITAIEKGEIGQLTKERKAFEIDIFIVTKKIKQSYKERLSNFSDNPTAPEALALVEEMNKTIASETAELRAELKTVSDKSFKVADQVTAMRHELEKDFFLFKTATGVELKSTIGDVMHYYYPNRLNTLERAGLFCSNIWNYLTAYPREANTEGGVFPAIIGTLMMTILMCIPVSFFGVIAAIYLQEYAKPGPVVQAVRIAINNLAGVPSIVYGAFGLAFFIYVVGGSIDNLFFTDTVEATRSSIFKDGSLLWASFTLALMTVPVVIVASEEAIASVSRGMKEGALGCGASKWQMIKTIVLPASAPGIITGMILAMARGAGEVAPLMLVGAIKSADIPLDSSFPFGVTQKFMHLGFHIYDLGFQSPDSEAAQPMVFATTLLLIVIVGILNLVGILIRQHLKKKYALGAF